MILILGDKEDYESLIPAPKWPTAIIIFNKSIKVFLLLSWCKHAQMIPVPVFVFRHYCAHCNPSQWFQLVARQYFCHVCTSQSAFFADPAHGAYGQARRYLETAWICSLRSQQGILNTIWVKMSKWAQVMTLRVSFHVEADMWPHNQPLFPAPLGLKLHPQAAAKPHASSVLSYPPFSGEIRGPHNESLWSI